MLSRKILNWDQFNFSTNVDVAGAGIWTDLLTFEISQLNIRKFFGGKGFQLKVPTAEQKSGIDLSATDTHTVSLANSIPDIAGPNTEYQVQGFADAIELPVSSIDAISNEVTLDTSGVSATGMDITIFYLSDASGQFCRGIIQASTSEWDSFIEDDLGTLHSLDQRNIEQRSTINNDLSAPEFFYVKLQVKSDLSYITDPSQNSDFNDYAITTDVNKFILSHKMQPLNEYMAKEGTPDTREAVKEAITLQLTH